MLPGSGLAGIGIARAIGCHARRNRQRRRLREALRTLHISELSKFDTVVIGNEPATGLKLPELAASLGELIQVLIGRWEKQS